MLTVRDGYPARFVLGVVGVVSMAGVPVRVGGNGYGDRKQNGNRDGAAGLHRSAARKLLVRFLDKSHTAHPAISIISFEVFIFGVGY